MKKIHPESKIELTPLIAKHYDGIMNFITLGSYSRFIKNAINSIDVMPDDNILDLGCGTGRNSALLYPRLGSKGSVTGIDISEVMEKQFLQKFNGNNNVNFIRQRVDIPFTLDKQFDKVLVSFVIHGLPHESRKELIKNVVGNLKPGGEFYLLDFSEFDMAKMPTHHRIIFKKVECLYAFDYIERDWKKILTEYGFSGFEEQLYMKKYVRLLKAVKE